MARPSRSEDLTCRTTSGLRSVATTSAVELYLPRRQSRFVNSLEVSSFDQTPRRFGHVYRTSSNAQLESTSPRDFPDHSQ